MNLFSGGDPNATFFVVGVLLALIVWHLNLHFAPSRALHIFPKIVVFGAMQNSIFVNQVVG